MVKDIRTFFEIIDKKMNNSELVQLDTMLRPYQQEAKKDVMEGWKTCRRILLQMPTGAGKTRLFVSLIQDIRMMRKGARVLIVTHRTELVEQISRSLTEHYGLEHGILKNSVEETWQEAIVVASIQMLERRLKKMRPVDCPGAKRDSFDYIIIDEAHHSLAKGYQTLWEEYPTAYFLGVTATPYRLRKASCEKMYDRLLVSWQTRQLIDKEWLADYELWTVSSCRTSLRAVNRLKKFGANGDYRQQDLGAIMGPEEEIDFLYTCYQTYAPGKKGIVYAVNREHAERIAVAFKAKGLGAIAMDCKTPKGERRRLIEAFKDGREIDILVNVELFTEGFDCPAIEFVMLARPTRSLAMYLQQVGRSLRPSPNRQPVTILDCAGLYHRFGQPDRQRDWESHFKGLKIPQEEYSKRSLGETEPFRLMKYMERRRLYPPKKQYEILPSDTDIHIFKRLDGSRKYGLMDKDGKIICRSDYDELGRTPFGWYIGVIQLGIVRYTDIIDVRHGKTYNFDTIRKIDDITYEAETYGDRGALCIRFTGMLKLVPLRVIQVNGVSIYLISDIQRKMYSVSLRMDAPLFFSYEPCGDKYVILDRYIRKREAFITDGTTLRKYDVQQADTVAGI